MTSSARDDPDRKAGGDDPSGNEEILSEVLALERSIGTQLDEQRQAARQWIEQERTAIEQAKLAEFSALKETAARDQEAAKIAAQQKAAAILRAAAAEAERIARLEDAQLIPLVRQQLGLIAQRSAE
jgi:hypothetical protein